MNVSSINRRKKYNNRNIKNYELLLLILLLSIFTMLMTFYFSSATFNIVFFKSYLKSPILMIMNLLPIYVLMLVFIILTDRIWLGNLLTNIIFFSMGMGNKYKIFYRDEPFNFMDIKLLSEAGDMAGKYDIGLTIPMFLIILAILLITYILRKNLERLNIGTLKKIVLILIIVIFSILITRKIYYNDKIYEYLGDKDIINIWSETQQYQSKGFVYPFIYSIKTSKDRVLEDYDEEKAIQLLSDKSYEKIPENKKVNYISIMLEAYNDFSVFDNVELNKDIYKNFHKIQKNSYHGNLITNVFGGGTVNTEWSYLTGYNSHPDYVKKTNSHVWYFKKEGYFTEFMHPNYGWFYNRRNVNEYLGFDNFDYYENKFEKIDKDFLEDYKFFDYIIEGYEKSRDKSIPYFHFSVTYQNHGPYSQEKLTDIEYLKRKDNYDIETYNIINNYFSGISKTDKALGKLIEYFEKEDEPVVLVIFGDHNPWLGEENKGFEMLNIGLNLENEDEFINYYRTPYLYWANDSAKKTLGKDFQQKGEDISPNFLMTQLFDYVGYKGDEYMQYTSDVMDSFTVNHDMYFKENGKFTRDLTEENYRIWREFNSVQYYRSRNFVYR